MRTQLSQRVAQRWLTSARGRTAKGEMDAILKPLEPYVKNYARFAKDFMDINKSNIWPNDWLFEWDENWSVQNKDWGYHYVYETDVGSGSRGLHYDDWLPDNEHEFELDVIISATVDCVYSITYKELLKKILKMFRPHITNGKGFANAILSSLNTHQKGWRQLLQAIFTNTYMEEHIEDNLDSADKFWSVVFDENDPSPTDDRIYPDVIAPDYVGFGWAISIGSGKVVLRNTIEFKVEYE